MISEKKNTDNTKLLIISHAFPPNGGSGVQRIVKFVKYLPFFGVSASVVTSKSINRQTSDESLLSDIPLGSSVLRTYSIDPMLLINLLSRLRANGSGESSEGRGGGAKKKLSFLMVKFFIFLKNLIALPDLYIGWIPFAVAKGVLRVRKDKSAAVLASLPVYSNAVAGYLISKFTGVPLILDFRDGWVDDPYIVLPTKIHYHLHNFLEKKIVGHSKEIIVYGDFLNEILSAKYPDKSITSIMNGYDPDDYDSAEVIPRIGHKTRIVFTGKLFKYNVEFLRLLFGVLHDLPSSVRERFEIIFVGDIECEEYTLLKEEYKLHGTVSETGYLPHYISVGHLLAADYLLFSLPADNTGSYSGKIFEYLGSQKPIIGIVNEGGVAASMLKEFGFGDMIVGYQQNVLRDLLVNISGNKYVAPVRDWGLLEKINRKSQAAKLAEIVRAV